MKHFSKLPFLLLAFILINILSINNSNAQIYGNEWIDYNATNYKIAVWSNKIYKINQQTLLNAGIPSSTLASDLKLMREGEEIAMLTSTNGVMGTNDYVEFFGMPADGKLDAELYVAGAQTNPKMNLISDTVYYYLVITNGVVNKRYQSIPNVISSPPPMETYCWDSLEVSPRTFPRNGLDVDVSGEHAFESSRFDFGEGYARSTLANSLATPVFADSILFTLTGLYNNAAAPNIRTFSRHSGQSLQNHVVSVYINNNFYLDSTFTNYENQTFTINNIPTSQIPANNRLWYKTRISGPASGIYNYDVIAHHYNIVYYPRTFAFSGLTNNWFEMDAKPSGCYIEITGFTHTTQAPTLYDITNNKVYTGVLSNATNTAIVKFQLPATTTKTQYYLVNQNSVTKVNVNYIKPITYVNYANNQADYVIFAPDLYINNGSAISNYKAYRESALGGGHTVAVVSFEQLYEQYAYGMNYHATSVIHFLKQIKNNWTTIKPKYTYFIGKPLVYNELRVFDVSHASNPNYRTYQVVTPTFGMPGSDNLLVDIDKNTVPDFAVGRLSANTESEVQDYLNKVKIYEADQKNTLNQTADEASWKKRVMHLVAGGTQQNIVKAYMLQAENIIEDTTYGASVFTSEKATNNVIDVVESAYIDSLVNSGLALVHFFGHSSSLDFEYGLKDLQFYNANNKFNVLMASGCNANNCFFNDPDKSIAEKYCNDPSKGSIVVIGSNNSGYPNELARYNDTLYKYFRNNPQNLSIAEQIKATITNINPGISNMGRCHLEQIQLTGDPAIKFVSFSLPDYNVEDKYVRTLPSQITTADDSFSVKCKIQNLGAYSTKDSIVLQVKRTLEDNTTQTQTYIFPKGYAYEEEITFKFEVNKITSKGLNTIEIKIDANNVAAEITEANNTIIKQFYIFDEEIDAVFPYNFSIVHTTNLTLVGNTLNPFSTDKQYLFEMDTTLNFNSPKLLTTKIQSTGGVIEWKPNIQLMDSMVYYWRCAKDTANGVTTRNWSTKSFIYLANGTDGWNQSHYFQYLDNNFNVLAVDSSRNFNFNKVKQSYSISNATIGYPTPNDFIVQTHNVNQNYNVLWEQGGAYDVMHFTLIDTMSMEPLKNVQDPNNAALGRWGSKYLTSFGLRNTYEFHFSTPADRQKIMNFMDSIPSGYIVFVMPLQHPGSNRFATHFAADSLLNGGAPNTLYHKLKNVGFSMLDSFKSPRPWIFVYQKDLPGINVHEIISPNNFGKVTLDVNYTGTISKGSMQSDIIGPAASWESIKRLGYARDGFQTDVSNVDVYGVDSAKQNIYLFTLAGNDTLINFINANQYPILKLVYKSSDSLKRTAEQLHYWRVLFTPLPDAAIAPNLHFLLDTLVAEGQNARFEFAIKNVSNIPMDSMKVQIEILDAKNQKVNQQSINVKPLNPFESTDAKFIVNTNNLVGINYIFIGLNKAHKPAENTYVNNQGVKSFKVSGDEINPLLDVTFDGIHILKEALVSSRPLIKIKLRDDNKYLRLDDSSLIEVRLTKPGASQYETINYHKDTLKFMAASQNINEENVANLEYRPALLENNKLYTLEVIAKDKKGNASGTINYKVTFQVDNTQSITTLLNYPNPFTSSTRFVFTLTGSEVPDYMKIQILSTTGKVVREITKAELGPIHIGDNITEYAWDGTDQMGDKLGNGVYFYRFVTSHKGKSILKRELQNTGSSTKVNDLTRKGMGKMVLIR
jgi:flagellar hook assembly protein FlgD